MYLGDIPFRKLGDLLGNDANVKSEPKMFSPIW